MKKYLFFFSFFEFRFVNDDYSWWCQHCTAQHSCYGLLMRWYDHQILLLLFFIAQTFLFSYHAPQKYGDSFSDSFILLLYPRIKSLPPRPSWCLICGHTILEIKCSKTTLLFLGTDCQKQFSISPRWFLKTKKTTERQICCWKNWYSTSKKNVLKKLWTVKYTFLVTPAKS